MVAITSSGDLVLLDIETGATIRAVRSGLAVSSGSAASIAVAPGGVHAYLGDGERGELLRISLTDGATEPVAVGWYPAINPDGTKLAFVSRDPETASSAQGLTVLDLSSGSLRHLPTVLGPTSADDPLLVTSPTWSADGRFVYVGRGYAEALSVVAVDTSAAAALDAAARLGPPLDRGDGTSSSQSWEQPTLLADGRLAVFAHEQGYEPAPESMHIALLDPSTAEVLELIDTDGRWVAGMSACRSALGLAIVFQDGTLSIWDGTTLRHLTEGIKGAAWQ